MIEIGSYKGLFSQLPGGSWLPQALYVGPLRGSGGTGLANVLVTTDRTVINLQMATQTPGARHDVFLGDVLLGQAVAGRFGFIDFRFDSSSNSSVSLPELKDGISLRVGQIASASLRRLGR
jgi:hypothetical protein